MRLDQSKPPETIDMSGVIAAHGPASGKEIQVFILMGEVGRRGPWLSRYLPRDVRVGTPGVLMFEDGRWHPLRPVGVRHGLEIFFAGKMAELLPDETVGVLVVPESNEDLLATAKQAAEAAPCRFLSLIRIGDGKLGADDEYRTLLSEPELLVVDMPPWFQAFPTDSDRLEEVREKGVTMARDVFDLINKAKE